MSALWAKNSLIPREAGWNCVIVENGIGFKIGLFGRNARYKLRVFPIVSMYMSELESTT